MHKFGTLYHSHTSLFHILIPHSFIFSFLTPSYSHTSLFHILIPHSFISSYLTPSYSHTSLFHILIPHSFISSFLTFLSSFLTLSFPIACAAECERCYLHDTDVECSRCVALVEHEGKENCLEHCPQGRAPNPELNNVCGKRCNHIEDFLPVTVFRRTWLSCYVVYNYISV